MNGMFKKISIFTVIIVLLSAAILCCCIHEPAQAEEILPSCHQTADESQTHQTEETDDCECHDSVLILQNKNAPNFDLIQNAFLAVINVSGAFEAISQNIESFVAPPQVIVRAVPSYIQNATLRL